MIGSILSGALAVGSTIYGGIKASEAMKNIRENTKKQKEKNQDWYDRRYNEDATQRADAQRILQITQDSIRQRNRAAQGSAAVMGATEESVAATKAANSQAMADAAGQISANAANRKDAIENQYMATDNALTNQQNQLDAQQAGNIAQAVGGVVDASGNMAGSLSDILKKKEE